MITDKLIKEKQRKLRILLLTHFYPPEMGAAASRLYGLARWLGRWEHQVTILTGFPNYPTGKIPREYKWKSRVYEGQKSNGVVRTWVFATSHRSSIRRLLNYLSFVFSATVTGILLKKKFDIILVSSPPLFIGITGIILSKIFKKPFVLDIRDLWPDVAVQTGVFTEKSIPMKWSRHLADYIYNRASHLTPVTESKYIRLRELGLEEEKMTVVMNGVDFDRLNLSHEYNWRKKLEISSKFVITYTGLIGIAQGVGIAVEAANLLRNNTDIHFVVVGDGVERDKLINRSKQLKLNNITFVARLPHEAIPPLMAASNVALVPLVSSALQDAVPSKLLEAWACRKTVILAARGEAADLVRKSKGGIIISPNNPHDLKAAIISLYEDRNLLKQYSDAGYFFVHERFDRKIAARKMENVLTKVVKENIQ